MNKLSTLITKCYCKSNYKAVIPLRTSRLYNFMWHLLKFFALWWSDHLNVVQCACFCEWKCWRDPSLLLRRLRVRLNGSLTPVNTQYLCSHQSQCGLTPVNTQYLCSHQSQCGMTPVNTQYSTHVNHNGGLTPINTQYSCSYQSQ